MLLQRKYLHLGFMAVLVATLLSFSLTASAHKRHHSKHHSSHSHQNTGELIKFLGVETSINDRRAYYRYSLSSVLDKQTERCERYAGYYSESRQLRKFKKCLRSKLNRLKRWRTISRSEKKELRNIVKDFTLEPEPATSTVNGRLTLADGSSASQITVTATSSDNTIVTTTSDAEGNFSLSLTPETTYTLNFSADGYADQVENIVSPAEDNNVSIAITMIARNPAQNVVDGGITEGQDGAAVTANVADFVDAEGNAVEGTLQVSITPVDVSNPASIGAFPGAFSGIPEGLDTDSPIYSLGVVEYEFSVVASDGAVTDVNLAENTTAEILIPIYDTTLQDGTELSVGDTIPLWSLNETTGIWLQEGTGIVVEANTTSGLALQATVSHFSWWNCDVSMNAGQAEITVNGPQNGSAIVTANASACDIGWRPSSVDTILSIGETSEPSPIPSGCEVCFTANVTYADGSIVTTDRVCEIAEQNQQLPITLTAALPGPLNLVANSKAGPISITTLMGFPLERVILNSSTFEEGVTYTVSTTGDALPEGLTLRSVNAISAELAGIVNAPGNYAITIDGVDSTGQEQSSVTINYNVVDPATSELPIFIHSKLYLPFSQFHPGPVGYDVNQYNVGGASTDWELVESDQEIPAWFSLSSEGNLNLTGTYPQGLEASDWTGIIRATTSEGTAETEVRICTTFCSPDPTPLPGDYEINIDFPFIAFREGNVGFVKFYVELNQVANVDITVTYTTFEAQAPDCDCRPATAGLDYIESTGTATVPAGEDYAEIRIPIFDDDIQEYTESFYLKISDNTAGRIGIDTAKSLIYDNDVSLSGLDSQLIPVLVPVD